VGTDVRSWEDGKCLIFDDSYEHEVWNTTSERRIVLLVRFWHPLIGDWGEAVAHAEENFRRYRCSQLPPVGGCGSENDLDCVVDLKGLAVT
jgi:aspartyl/asparaginyl beta-hydroxylase (cupin superfamily)